MKDMWKKTALKIHDLTTQNVGLKLLAIVSSVLLWLLVVNLDDPTQSRNFTATITVEHEEVLTDAGKYYELPNGNTVTFRVTARRSVIESLSSSDFTATADLNYLEDDTRVPVEITAKRNTSQISISSKTHYLAVSVGENTETTFMIHAATTGEPGAAFEIGELTVTPTVINIEGPSELVSTIESVSVVVDVTGRSEDATVTAVPKCYNSDGQEVDTTTLTLSADSVDVFIDVLSVQDVKIDVETSGSLRDGLELDQIKTSPETIRLRGQAETLNSLTTVTIPGDVINLSEIKDDFETTIDILSYLPEGISVASNVSSQVKIVVSIISEDSETFRVRTSNLTIQNLSPGLVGTFQNKVVEVSVAGLESELSGLDAATITGSVDASGLSEGIHSVSVTLDLDEGLEAKTATTDIEIKALGEPDDRPSVIRDEDVPEGTEEEEEEELSEPISDSMDEAADIDEPDTTEDEEQLRERDGETETDTSETEESGR